MVKACIWDPARNLGIKWSMERTLAVSATSGFLSALILRFLSDSFSSQFKEPFECPVCSVCPEVSEVLQLPGPLDQKSVLLGVLIGLAIGPTIEFLYLLRQTWRIWVQTRLERLAKQPGQLYRLGWAPARPRLLRWNHWGGSWHLFVPWWVSWNCNWKPWKLSLSFLWWATLLLPHQELDWHLRPRQLASLLRVWGLTGLLLRRASALGWNVAWQGSVEACRDVKRSNKPVDIIW